MPSFRISCSEHGGSGKVAINEWDARARAWRQVTDYYDPDRELIDPLIKADADKFATENEIKRRDCR